MGWNRVLAVAVCSSVFCCLHALPSSSLPAVPVSAPNAKALPHNLPLKGSHGIMERLRGGKKKAVKESVTLFSMTTKPQVGYQKAALPLKLGMLDLGPTALLKFMAESFLQQAAAVLPLCVFLAGFQVLVLGQSIEDFASIAGGLVLVMLGLAFFNFGLLYGLMPMGKTLGLRLPDNLSLNNLLLVTGALGVAVTLAEPALSVVKTAGSLIQENQAPYLYTLLHHRTDLLVLAVAAGVGLSASFGMLRIVQQWSLKPVAIGLSFISLALSCYVNWWTDRKDLIGLAWDLGAVTTGPVTVPIVIALGVGIASTSGSTPSPLTGFGVVTLASLIPVNTVLLLGLTLPDATLKTLKSAASKVSQAASTPIVPWHQQTPMLETVQGLQALTPLVLLMYGLLRVVLKDKGDMSTMVKVDKKEVVAPAALALCAAQLGLIIFNIGLTKGLAKLGTVVGSVMPAAFTAMAQVKQAPIWDKKVGMWVALLFSWLLGFGATLAEPALSTLAITVEKLTDGGLKRGLVVGSVAVGVGTGIALGVLKIVAGLPLLPMLLVGYAIVCVLTLFSPEVLANVAWDSAGVTTGPITVPLVISLGLGLGNALGVSDGFGILSLASVCPIMTVLMAGLLAGSNNPYSAASSTQP